jgi:hypothetical protein
MRTERPTPKPSATGTVVFQYRRDPDPVWVEQLDKLSPPETRANLSWYKLVWESGEIWSPIQRWVIWQMHPKGFLPKWIHPDAFKIHPRSTGHPCFEGHCHCKEKAGCWVGGPKSAFGIDRVTYELYHETGCYGQRYWVVQGSKGGHRRRYDEIETAVALAMGRPGEPPVMGDLPYANPDERTFRAIRNSDRLLSGKNLIDACRLNPAMAQAEDRARAEDAMRAIGAFLDAQIEERSDHVYSALRRTTDHEVPRVSQEHLRQLRPNVEAIEQRFLHNNGL